MFCYLVDETLLHKICNYGKRNTKVYTNSFHMSIHRFPNVPENWSKNLFEIIRKAMTRNRFDEIRAYLHFHDNINIVTRKDPGYDPVNKVRPIIVHFNQRFGSVLMYQRLCVDEQMYSTEIASLLRNYMLGKTT